MKLILFWEIVNQLFVAQDFQVGCYQGGVRKYSVETDVQYCIWG